MRMDKLTSKFQLALADAQSLAVGRDNQLIEPEHVMVALLDQEGGSIRHLQEMNSIPEEPAIPGLRKCNDILVTYFRDPPFSKPEIIKKPPPDGRSFCYVIKKI